jgi:hypothetical protein
VITSTSSIGGMYQPTNQHTCIHRHEINVVVFTETVMLPIILTGKEIAVEVVTVR